MQGESAMAMGSAPLVAQDEEVPVAAELKIVESGAWRSDFAVQAHRPRQLRKVAALCVASLAVAGVSLAATRGLKPQPTEADVSKDTELVVDVGLGTIMTSLANGVKGMAAVTNDLSAQREDIMKAKGFFGGAIEAEREAIIAEGIPNITNLTDHYANLRGKHLIPRNDLEDGNSCPEGEEVHVGLCYKTCESITEGVYPIRTSAFTCCKEEPCSFFNSKFSNPIYFCSGMDVGESHGKKVCPYPAGDCMRNEELEFGVCYKRCGLLTDWKYPFRMGATSCCRYNSQIACLDPNNVVSDMDYAVGGAVGQGKEDYGDVAGMPHPPLPEFAEEQPEVGPAGMPALWPAAGILHAPAALPEVHPVDAVEQAELDALKEAALREMLVLGDLRGNDTDDNETSGTSA